MTSFVVHEVLEREGAHVTEILLALLAMLAIAIFASSHSQAEIGCLAFLDACLWTIIVPNCMQFKIIN